MSAPRTNMHRLQELLRLHRTGLSVRKAARQLRMGRNTAQRYLGALGEAGLLEGPADELPDLAVLKAAVEAVDPTHPPPQQTSSVAAWEPRIQQMLARKAGPKAIYDALRLDHPEFDGSYDAVKRMCRRLRQARPPASEDVAIHVDTAPGEVAQVDFFEVGKLFDPAQGRLRRTWAFVILLGFSRHMYADLVFDQKAETWQRQHAAAFAFFGGVPAVMVPDNTKVAVLRAAFTSSGEVALNRSYVELARHYGFQVDPTPPYQPKKKGKVERAGRYVRDNYLRPRAPADIHEARAGLRAWLLQIAGQRIHGTTGKRPLELFETAEKPALQPLPPMPFAPVIWHRAKVHADSHLQFRQRLYSVPWRLMNQTVWVRATHESVVIYADDERVATHRRADGRGRSTLPGHLPPRREQWGHRSRVYWEERASKLGDEVFTYVLELFDDDDVLLPLRKVQAIVSFLEDFPSERREAACRRARFYGVTTVRAFKDILRKGLDHEPLPNTLLAVHGELERPRFARGAAAFTHPTPEA